MDDNERMEAVKRHQEKWKKWRQEMKSNPQMDKGKFEGNLEENAHNYAIKLIEKLQEPEKKDANMLKNK